MADYNAQAMPGGAPQAGPQDDLAAVVAYNYSAAPAAADATPPSISNVTPASGSEIAADDSVQFDVTDASSFHAILVYVRFAATEDYEVAHDGDSFTPRYARNSTRSVISGGYRYVLRRWGNWPSAPQIKIFAVDSSGNESS